MNASEIIEEVNGLFIDVLENPDIVLKRETSAKDLEEWDSLNHIQLVVAIEKHFKLRFASGEIQKWRNVGDMCDAIEKMLAR